MKGLVCCAEELGLPHTHLFLRVTLGGSSFIPILFIPHKQKSVV